MANETIEVLRIPGTLFPRGPFDENASYKFLNFVESGGNGYVCLQPCTGIPVTNTAYWFKFVFKGDKGDAFTYADLTAEQKAELVRDATAAAQAAASSAQSAADDAAAALQKFNTIKAAIDALDPTSTEGSIQTLAAKQGLLEADLDALGPQMEQGEADANILHNACYVQPSSIFRGYIDSGGTWKGIGESGHRFLLFRIEPSDTLVLKTYSNVQSMYALLKGFKTPVRAESALFCNDAPSRYSVNTNSEATITAPQDARYLYVSLTYNGTSNGFKSVTINGTEMINDSFLSLINGCKQSITNLQQSVSTNAGEITAIKGLLPSADFNITKDIVWGSPNTSFYGNLNGANKWTNVGESTYQYRLFPIKQGDTVYIKSATNNQAFYAFLSGYVSPVNGELALLCSGTSRVTINANSEATATAPQDAKYLFVLTLYNNIQTFRPSTVLINGKSCFFDVSMIDYLLNIQNGDSQKGGVLKYDSTAKSFEFISRVAGTDKYYSFIVSLVEDDTEIVYLKEWRLTGGYLYEYDGTTFQQGASLLANGENECAIQFTGKSDYTGGFHGDERIDVFNGSYVKFFADGTLITAAMMQSDFTMSCDIFEYVQYSTLHETTSDGETAISGHPIIAYHYKKNVFRDGCSTLTNKVKMASQQSITQFHAGIWCTDQDSVDYAIVPSGELHELSKSHNSFISDNKEDAIVDYYGVDIRLSIEGHILQGFDDKVDVMPCFVLDWDRYAKYYRRTSSAKIFDSNDIIINQQIARYY